MKRSNAKYISQRISEIEDTEDLLEVSEAVETKLAGREIDANKHELVHITQLEKEIDEYSKTWGKTVGITTGYHDLDANMRGMAKGEVILIAGGTSAGKSALAANIAVNVAKTQGTVLYITLEMLQAEIGSRIKHINGGEFMNLDLLFQTSFSLDWRDYEPIVKNAMENDVQLIVLDYMQYLSRQMTLEEVAKMSKEIKRIALEYKIPVIVITQMRKRNPNDKRTWADMEIEDIMGTASIGYDADQAMLVSRRDENNEYQANRFYIKYLKNRSRGFNDQQPFVTLEWDRTRISNLNEWLPEVRKDLT